MTKKRILGLIVAGALSLASAIGCVEESQDNIVNSSSNNAPNKQTESNWTLNQLTSNCPSDIAIVTTSRLPREQKFQEAIKGYMQEVFQNRGLKTNYVELDSLECKALFGLNSSETTEEITLDKIVEKTNPRYIILLGNNEIIARPERKFILEARCIISVPSDSWYCDLNKDNIIDANRAIGRIDSYSHSSEEIIAGLQTAIKLHKKGGLIIDSKVNAGMPRIEYALCTECKEKNEFKNDISKTTLLSFTGHGSPYGLSFGSGNYEERTNLSAIDLKKINFENSPLIVAFGPCYTASFSSNERNAPRLSVEFVNSGASGFIGNTVAEGYPTKFKEIFDSNLKKGITIGEALSNAARQISQENPNLIVSTHQYQLYGDPSIQLIDITEDP